MLIVTVINSTIFRLILDYRARQITMALTPAMEEKILKLLRDYYNIRTLSARRIESYVNINLQVRDELMDKKEEPKCEDSKTYLAKIFLDFDDEDHLSLQQLFMANLNKHDIPTSQLILSKDGHSCIKFKSEGKINFLQVLSFLHGKSINKTCLNDSEFLDICYKVGVTLARMHKATEDFTHTSRDLPGDERLWMVSNSALAEENLHRIKDDLTRKLATKFLQIFRKEYLPVMSKLRHGFVHGDFSDTNIIIERKDTEWDISGVIDFEDCHYGSWVGDLGVCCAYFLARAFDTLSLDCLVAVKRLLAGYQSVIPLTPVEKGVLLPVTCSRLVLSYSSACKLVSEHPENEEYLFCQAKPVPSVLRLIDSFEEGEIHRIWFQ